MAVSRILCRNQFHVYKNFTDKVRLLHLNGFYNPEDEHDEIDNISRTTNKLKERYYKFTGLDKVKLAKEKTEQIKEKLEKAQDDRKKVGKLLFDVRGMSNTIQEELGKISKWEDVHKYTDLRRQEIEIAKTEMELQKNFDHLYKSEQDVFTAYSAATKEFHDEERTHANLNKYWKFIFSVGGAFVCACLSVFVTHYSNKSLVHDINKSLDTKIEKFQDSLKSKSNSWSWGWPNINISGKISKIMPDMKKIYNVIPDMKKIYNIIPDFRKIYKIPGYVKSYFSGKK